MASLERLGAWVAGYRPDDRARLGVRGHVADTIGACGVFVFGLLPKKRPAPAIVPYGLRKM